MVDVLIAKDHMVSVVEAKGNGNAPTMQIYYQSHTRNKELEAHFLPISFNDYLFSLKQAQKSGNIPDFSHEGIVQLRQDIKASKPTFVDDSTLTKSWHQNVGP